MYTAFSASSMALYLVFFSRLATIAIATWKIFEQVIQFHIFQINVRVIETRPREIGLVLWGHCQNLLDDPRNWHHLILPFLLEDPYFNIDIEGPDIKDSILCGI